MPSPGGSIFLAVHCKRSEPLELKEPVLDYVSRTYGQQVGLGRAALLHPGRRRALVSRSRRGLQAGAPHPASPTACAWRRRGPGLMSHWCAKHWRIAGTACPAGGGRCGGRGGRRAAAAQRNHQCFRHAAHDAADAVQVSAGRARLGQDGSNWQQRDASSAACEAIAVVFHARTLGAGAVSAWATQPRLQVSMPGLKGVLLRTQDSSFAHQWAGVLRWAGDVIKSAGTGARGRRNPCRNRPLLCTWRSARKSTNSMPAFLRPAPVCSALVSLW